LLAAALAIGTFTDTAAHPAPMFLGGYRVLSGDLHLHPFPLSASSLTPWDLMWDAQHDGVDVVAISGHNEVWSGRAARWISRHLGGPTVLAAEEIHGPRFHMIAAGIHSNISWRLSAAEAIEEIHRQGGVAIAAHPTGGAWRAYDSAAMRQLDGSEVLQPTAYNSAQSEWELRKFYGRKPMAAIGSSDWHGLGRPGLCRTWLFVHADNEREVLQAIRDRHTVVYDRGEYFGDPALVALARTEPRLTQSPRPPPWAVLSRTLGLVGLLGLLWTVTMPGPE
jgi:hypothetical protein